MKNNPKIRIALIGDSTMQWIRPYRNHKDEFSYVEMLMKIENIHVDVYSMPNITSQDALILVYKKLQGKFYDYYIFDVGINDCSPRNYPKFFIRMQNDIVVPRNLFQKILSSIFEKVASIKIQKLFSRLKLSFPWISVKKFKEILEKIVYILEKETDAKMIFINIPPTTKRVEDILQGISKNIIKYNEAFEEIKNENVYIVDSFKVCKKNYDLYIPEGIHYGAKGHKFLYEEIVNIIQNDK